MVIRNEGTVVSFTPEGDFEHEWLVLNTNAEPWQWLGKSLVVDHRFADDVEQGIVDAGFIIERE